MSQFFTLGGQSIGISASASNEYSALISFRIDWFGLFAVQGTLKSLFQHHSSKAPFLQYSTFFMIQFSHLPGAIMGGPTRDEVMKKIPGRQGCPGPHPWRGREEKTWQARPSRIRDPPGWPQPLPHPVSSPLFCRCSCLPCCKFLCCLPRALLQLFHWMRTNLKP